MLGPLHERKTGCGKQEDIFRSCFPGTDKLQQGMMMAPEVDSGAQPDKIVIGQAEAGSLVNL